MHALVNDVYFHMLDVTNDLGKKIELDLFLFMFQKLIKLLLYND